MLGLLHNQAFNLRTDSKTLYYSILKLKYSPSIETQQRLKERCITTAIITATEITRTSRIFLQIHMLRSIDRSLHPTGCMP